MSFFSSTIFSFAAIRTLIKVLIAGLIVAGCSGGSSKKDGFTNTVEQKLYESAQGYLRRNQFISAVEALQKLESDFPFGRYANSAQLALIYAYYKSDEFPLAISAANRYIRLHPNHPNVDYAYYMRGLASFPRPASLFQSVFGTDFSKRDMKSPRTSFIQFLRIGTAFSQQSVHSRCTEAYGISTQPFSSL